MVSYFKRKLIEIISLQGFWLNLLRLSAFNVSDLNGIKLLTCLHVKFSDLHEHKFRHNFYATPMCVRIEDIELLTITSYVASFMLTVVGSIIF